jgi:polysaccharide biosynthesis transport protein
MTRKIATALARYDAMKNGNGGQEFRNEGAAFKSTRTSAMEETHLSDYVEILKRRKWVVISVFITIVAAVSLVSFIMTPTYEATAVILLGGQPTPMNPLGDSSDRIPERTLFYTTQVNLLKNRSLAINVIKDLQLERVYSRESKFGIFRFFRRLGRSAEKKAGKSGALGPEYAQMSRFIEWYLKHLGVTPVRDSSLVKVSFSGKDPQLITRIINRHAEIALENTVVRHRSKAKGALDWLKAQIADQRKEVEKSQRAIYEFKKRFNVLSMEDSTTALSQEMKELNSALTMAKSDRIAKQAVYLQLEQIANAKGNVMLMPEISNYPIIQALRAKLVELKGEQIEMGTKYGPRHPKMIKLNSGIRQIEAEIQAEANRLEKSIKAELDRAIDVENKLAQSLEHQKQNALSIGERGIEYEVLKQQAESRQDVYDFLLKQSEEIGLSSAISSSNMRIVDEAAVPVEPVRPKILLNILAAMAFSLVMGTGLAFFLEYLDNTIKTPMDVSIKLGLPVLGMIPFENATAGKFNAITGPGAGTYRLGDNLPATPIYHISNRLPAELRSPADGLFGRVLIVESVTLGEGKTTVVSQIASNLTDAGLRVLLVDCDFQRPSLDKLFNLSRNGGLGKAIDKIMSHQLTKGTLQDYSVDDLFFLVALKKKSGHLTIHNEDQTFIAHFQNGVLVHLQNQNSPENSRIGFMLQKGGFITEEQLNYALVRHRRTGQPLGYILVNAGYIGRDKLRGPLRLQIEEYIQKVFSWKNGEFLFKPGITSIYENEKIFFEEDYTPYINSLGRIESSKFIENELFSYITSLNKENLYLLPSGASHKLIGSLNQVLMRKIFEKLKHHFDVVLIDTPPLDAASGIESIFHLADGIILVVKAGHLSVKILNGAINHLPEDKIIGTVLNQVKVNPQPYYY